MNTMKISISHKFYSAFYLWSYALQVGPRGRTARSPLIISPPAIYFVLPSYMSGRRCTRLQAHYCQSVAGCNLHDGRTLFSVLCSSSPPLSGPVLDGCITDSSIRRYRHSTFCLHHLSDVFRPSLWFSCLQVFPLRCCSCQIGSDG
jgi:hypothetical protein